MSNKKDGKMNNKKTIKKVRKMIKTNKEDNKKTIKKKIVNRKIWILKNQVLTELHI